MKQEDWKELNEKSHYRALQKQDTENRKLIKKLQLEREELKKQLFLYGVVDSSVTISKQEYDALKRDSEDLQKVSFSM
ncbi:hypothetical protein [Altibacter sp. HG106]|uniref:hypothetical protein n=1 Tax=Altibacter sp. HG106 TaxID=3023937 RepID=UPI0023507D24|nr:hypothetical protein [Altibacter sp. HG106]MDC7994443.1 hypothetical protein [Altibacter sp. HG106]